MNKRLRSSPVSPLENKDNKKTKMGGKCVSCMGIPAPEYSVACEFCKNLFDHKCAFVNDNQANYFKSKEIPWLCPACYTEKLNENDSAIQAISTTLNDLKLELSSSAAKVDTLQTKLTTVRQEIVNRCADIESKVDSFETRIENFEDCFSSNYLEVKGLEPKSFENSNAITQFFIQLLIGLGFNRDIYFKTKWNFNTKIVSIIFLDKSVALAVYKRYCSIASLAEDRKQGIFTADFADLKVKPCYIFIHYVPDQPTVQRRLDAIEYDRLSRDIKISGLEYNVSETPDTLKSIIMKIIQNLNPAITEHDFMVRRPRLTDTCIVSFLNATIRDSIFYTYVNKMVKERSGGLDPKIIGVNSSTTIVLNDNLTTTTRILYDFARDLKKKGNLANFSTRRGKVVVKKRNGDQWEMIHSIDELFAAVSDKL